jgi:hypothetical protein
MFDYVAGILVALLQTNILLEKLITSTTFLRFKDDRRTLRISEVLQIGGGGCHDLSAIDQNQSLSTRSSAEKDTKGKTPKKLWKFNRKIIFAKQSTV